MKASTKIELYEQYNYIVIFRFVLLNLYQNIQNRLTKKNFLYRELFYLTYSMIFTISNILSNFIYNIFNVLVNVFYIILNCFIKYIYYIYHCFIYKHIKSTFQA